MSADHDQLDDDELFVAGEVKSVKALNVQAIEYAPTLDGEHLVLRFEHGRRAHTVAIPRPDLEQFRDRIEQMIGACDAALSQARARRN